MRVTVCRQLRIDLTSKDGAGVLDLRTRLLTATGETLIPLPKQVTRHVYFILSTGYLRPDPPVGSIDQLVHLAGNNNIIVYHSYGGRQELVLVRGVWSPYPLYVRVGFKIATVSSWWSPGSRLIPPGTTARVKPTNNGLEYVENKFFKLGTAARRRVCGEYEECLSLLVKALERAFKEALAPLRSASVSFSGGVDSSLVAFMARRHGLSVVLYSISDERGRGVEQALESASLLGLPLEVVKVGPDDVKEALVKLRGRIRLSSPMDLALAAGFNAVARRSSEEGFKVVLTGQMADELFGGYHKYLRLHPNPEELKKEMMTDIEAAGYGLARDTSSMVLEGVTPVHPYTHPYLVTISLSIPVQYMVRGRVRKSIFRDAATTLGLPEEITGLEKKSFQYSSGLQRLAEKAIKPF